MPARVDAVSMLQGLALGLLFTSAASRLKASPARSAGSVLLFRVVTMRADLLIGLTRQEIAALGAGAAVDRVAGRIAAEGQMTAWAYGSRRGTDGTQRLVPRHRVCLLRQDVLMVEAHEAALPVQPPPPA